MNKNAPVSLFANLTASQDKDRGFAPAIALTVATGYLTYHTFAEPSGSVPDFLAGLSVGILWVCVLFLWSAVSFRKSKVG